MFAKRFFYVCAGLFLLAAPTVVGAQAPLLTGGRTALMVQAGLDYADIDQKAGDTKLIDFHGVQPWGAVTGLFASGPRASMLLGIGLASAEGTVDNVGKFVVLPGTSYYTTWKQKGYTLRIQVGTIVWFK